jgi:hypothetical protein
MSEVLEDIDYEDEYEEFELHKSNIVDNFDYDDINSIPEEQSSSAASAASAASSASSAVTEPFCTVSAKKKICKPSMERMLVKNTIKQKIFVESKMIEELGTKFNCQINFRHDDIGRYALFIRPKDTNYMINVTNGLDENNQERIFFNLSLNRLDDKSSKLIKTEYMSQYIVDEKENYIYHEYKITKGEKPATITKNTVSLSETENIDNEYLILNELISKHLFRVDPINMKDNITYINQIIINIEKQRLEKKEEEQLEKVKKKFSTDEEKIKNDNRLNNIYLLNKRFLYLSLGDKAVEQINFKPKYKELYTTNNKFTDILAYRFANYDESIIFTKSSKVDKIKRILKEKQKDKPSIVEYSKVYEFTDPLKNKLETPFTATDIYFHKFDTNIGNGMYAFDRYNIKEPIQFNRLAELVELSKSIMMNFISISNNVMKGIVNDIYNININKIYSGLIWNKYTTPINNPIIWNGQFNIKLTKYKGKIQNILIKKSDIKDRLIELKPIRANEILYIGIVPIVALPKLVRGDVVEIKNKPIIEKYDKYLDNISHEIRGIERNLINGYPIDDFEMDRLYKDFFDKVREKPTIIIDAVPDMIVLTPEEYIKLFPLGSENIPIPIKEAREQQIKRDIEIKKTAKVSIPYSNQINNILIDLEALRKEIEKPIEEETRRARDKRRKTLEPLLQKLTDIRNKQKIELERINIKQPALPSMYTPTKSTRSSRRDFYIKLHLEEDKKKLSLETEQAREYENDAKSLIQKKISEKLFRIIEIKEIILLHPPSGSDKEIKKMLIKYNPLYNELDEINSELIELRKIDEEQQNRIAETVEKAIVRLEEKYIKMEKAENQLRVDAENTQLKAIKEEDKKRETAELMTKMTPAQKVIEEARLTQIAKERAEKAAAIEAEKVEKKAAKKAEKAALIEKNRIIEEKKTEQALLALQKKKEREQAAKEAKEAQEKADLEAFDKLQEEKRKQRQVDPLQEKMEALKKLEQASELARMITSFNKKKEALLKEIESYKSNIKEINEILANPGRRSPKEIKKLKEQIITNETNISVKQYQLNEYTSIQSVEEEDDEELDLSTVQKYLKYKTKYIRLKNRMSLL